MEIIEMTYFPIKIEHNGEMYECDYDLTQTYMTHYGSHSLDEIMQIQEEFYTRYIHSKLLHLKNGIYSRIYATITEETFALTYASTTENKTS